MAFSAVFTYYDLICLKLSILFLALGNVKTKLFLQKTKKKKTFLDNVVTKFDFIISDFDISIKCRV